MKSFILVALAAVILACSIGGTGCDYFKGKSAGDNSATK
jgi:hypothetical protein